MPFATVILPPILRDRAGNQKRIEVECGTVRAIIEELEQRFPGIQFNLCYETGELRPYVNVYLERENIRYLQGLDTPVEAGSQVRILPSVAGG